MTRLDTNLPRFQGAQPDPLQDESSSCCFPRELGADYMRRAGLLSRDGSVCQDLGTSVKHTKNQLRDYMKKFQPGQPE